MSYGINRKVSLTFWIINKRFSPKLSLICGNITLYRSPNPNGLLTIPWDLKFKYKKIVEEQRYPLLEFLDLILNVSHLILKSKNLNL